MACHPWFSHKPRFEAAALVASSGGMDVLEEIISRLPAHFQVPIVVLVHRRERKAGVDFLETHLARVARLAVMQARSGAMMREGVVYVAPPDCHLRVSAKKRFFLSKPEEGCNARPSADLLFESLAGSCGPRCIAVVLSGSLRDGAIGAVKIKASGGTVLVQDPATAFSPGMPKAAIATGCADFVLGPSHIADALTALTMVPGALHLFRVPQPAWANGAAGARVQDGQAHGHQNGQP